MASSSTVTAGVDVVEAAQYNDLRSDVLDPTTGHDHEGTDGKILGAGALTSNAVTTPKINDGAVTGVKLADDAVSNAKIADDAVNTAEILNDAVDDTKCGNRVIQFRRRQGGNSGNWDTPGTTSYTPTAVRMQAGVIQWTGSAATSGNITVTFPEAFSNRPIAFVCCADTNVYVNAVVTVLSSQTFQLNWFDTNSTTHTTIDFSWMVIGPE